MTRRLTKGLRRLPVTILCVPSCPLWLKLSSAFHRLQHGHFVGIFNIAAGRNTSRDSGDLHARTFQQTCEMDCRGLAFDCGISGDDYLIQAAALNPSHERRYPQVLWPNTMQRRNRSMENVINAIIKPRLFD